ncbi:MAG: cytochrome oxidase subunit III [Bacteroidia bacterium]|nr:MAG: cytochrome oxidase subunit III [Bacteroidia bacterium]
MKEELQLKRRAQKNILWLGIFSIIMLFSGLVSAYIIRSQGGNWLKFQLPDIFYFSTGVILMSSLTIYFAQVSIQKDNKKRTTIFLVTSLILGIVFSISQFFAWKELYQNGIVYAGKYSNPSGSFLYLLTALHLVHLLGGLIGLLITTIKNILGRYSSENYIGVELISIYWHFLDALWIFLFLFLIFIH